MDGMWREVKICLESDQYDKLKEKAGLASKTVSELFREWIGDFLEEKEKTF